MAVTATPQSSEHKCLYAWASALHSGKTPAATPAVVPRPQDSPQTLLFKIANAYN